MFFGRQNNFFARFRHVLTFWTFLDVFGRFWTFLDIFIIIWTYCDTFRNIWTYLTNFEIFWCVRGQILKYLQFSYIQILEKQHIDTLIFLKDLLCNKSETIYFLKYQWNHSCPDEKILGKKIWPNVQCLVPLGHGCGGCGCCSRGKSLLESWVTTFLSDWQPPLIFVRFTFNLLCMCSKSMA